MAVGNLVKRETRSSSPPASSGLAPSTDENINPTAFGSQAAKNAKTR